MWESFLVLCLVCSSLRDTQDHVLTIEGGGLSDPAEQFGGIFKQIEFFTEYPYALSTFVAGTIGASAVILCALFIKEVCLVLTYVVIAMLTSADTETESQRRSLASRSTNVNTRAYSSPWRSLRALPLRPCHAPRARLHSRSVPSLPLPNPLSPPN